MTPPANERSNNIHFESKKCKCRTGSMQVNKFLCLSILLPLEKKTAAKSDYRIGRMTNIFYDTVSSVKLIFPLTFSFSSCTVVFVFDIYHTADVEK